MTSTHNPGLTSKKPKISEGQLEPLFRRLNLAHTRRIYQDVADKAEKENWSYRDFLALLLAEEVAHRKQTRLQRFTRKAHFPFFKTIDEFDFSLQTTLRQSLLGSYLGPDFVTEGRSLILYGKTGRGKTHLAVAIGYRAIQNGFETLFTTAAELIEDLSNGSKQGHLQESLTTYTHPHVLVIDEVGYLTYGPDAANVLFHVVNDRHLRKRPMIFTTNKPLNQWGKVLHDEDMAAAILDRVLERGRFIHLDGPSGRTRHLNLEEILPASTDRARISGIDVPEFPEPTPILWRCCCRCWLSLLLILATREHQQNRPERRQTPTLTHKMATPADAITANSRVVSPSMRRPVSVKPFLSFFLSSSLFLLFPNCSHRAKPPLSPPFHPHSLLSDCRSVQVGCTRFSRCCYLIIDLYSPL
jgi:DNA replication protein DnaC